LFTALVFSQINNVSIRNLLMLGSTVLLAFNRLRMRLRNGREFVEIVRGDKIRV